MPTRVDYAEVLDLFLWTMDKLARPTLANLLAGYEEYAHRPENIHLFRHLERQRFLEQTGKRGQEPVFRITAEGIARTYSAHKDRHSSPQPGRFVPSIRTRGLDFQRQLVVFYSVNRALVQTSPVVGTSSLDSRTFDFRGIADWLRPGSRPVQRAPSM